MEKLQIDRTFAVNLATKEDRGLGLCSEKPVT